MASILILFGKIGVIHLRTIVVGDIHGCYNSLNHLLMNICKISKNDKIILLGDYIDRGPYIRQTIDYIVDLINMNYNIIALRGNHEQYLLDSLTDPKSIVTWMKNGGETTLNSFEVINPLFLEDKYIDFFQNTKYYYIEGNFVCVHAGLNFDKDNPFVDTKAMLSKRINSIISEKIDGRKLIVGHTPTNINDIKESLNTNLIKLDGGCVYHKKVKTLGNLVALILDDMQLFYTINIEDEK